MFSPIKLGAALLLYAGVDLKGEELAATAGRVPRKPAEGAVVKAAAKGMHMRIANVRIMVNSAALHSW